MGGEVMKNTLTIILLLVALLLTCSEPMNDKAIIPHALLVVFAWLLVAIVSNISYDKNTADRN